MSGQLKTCPTCGGAVTETRTEAGRRQYVRAGGSEHTDVLLELQHLRSANAELQRERDEMERRVAEDFQLIVHLRTELRQLRERSG